MLKSFWFWTIVTFIVMQFISFNIPAKLPIKKDEELHASPEVMSILKRSCYDCHSSQVDAPWYYSIAPISWITQLHVKNGRNIVNFSQWNRYSKEKKIKVLNKLPKSVVIRMPLPTYTYLHKESVLTKEEKKTVSKWAKDLKEKIK